MPTPHLPHQKLKGFKIWYSKSVFTSLDGDWKDAPADDVQVVMIYFEKYDALDRHTRLFSSGCDYYALNENGVFTSAFDDVSLVEGHVLVGKFMQLDKLETIMEEALNDYGEWLDPPKKNIDSRADGHGG